MPRATNGPASHRRHKRILKAAKGYRGARGRLYRMAIEAVHKGWATAFDGRKKKKSNFRKLWITRISIALHNRGFSYNRFIKALTDANIKINRKMLSEMIIHDEKGFDHLIAVVFSK